MIDNNEIVEIIELTAKLLELNGADDFKARSYTSAAYSLERFKGNLAELTLSQLVGLQGVGKSIANTILEIVQTGKHQNLEDLLAKTPEGVLEMFKIKGIGGKKIRIIWQELGIDNLNDLQIACQNGKIAAIKGFGEKTQDAILESLAFIQSQQGKLRMDKAEFLAEIILEKLKNNFEQVVITGQLRRKCEVVDTIQFVASNKKENTNFDDLFIQDEKNSSPFSWRGKFGENKIDVEILQVSENQLITKNFIYSATEKHLAHRNENNKTLLQIATETPPSGGWGAEHIYEKFGSPYIIPEMREGNFEFEWIKNHKNEELITWQNLKGIVHNHSTYSDGKHSLEQMANYCKELGFEYLGIADHSQTATYAQGLYPNKVKEQHQEIDKLNQNFLGSGGIFKILKGIESDILGDGSLDYSDDILASFDYVVASVHQNLTMNIAKATDRLLRAIENPYTTILGHPTGRLLLSRQGYPIDYQEVIDACAKNKVVIEINASPYRLDLDWRWIQYAVERGVLLSINPDAHEMQGYHDMNYGISIARKGGLTKDMTFNALSLTEMETYLVKSKKNKIDCPKIKD